MTVILRAAAWLSLLVVLVLTLGPIGLRPTSPAPAQIERFATFLAIGTLFGAGHAKRPLLIIGVVVAAAGLLELAQYLVPDRHAMLADFVAKAAGGSFGVLSGGYLAYFGNRLMARLRTQP